MEGLHRNIKSSLKVLFGRERKVIPPKSLLAFIIVMLLILAGQNLLLYFFLLERQLPSSLGIFLVGLVSFALLLFAVHFFIYVPLLSEFRKQQEEVRLSFNILDSSSEPILITDSLANIEYVNQAFCSVTGYSAEEVIGKNPRIMKSGKHDAEFFQKMWQYLNETGQWQGEIWDKRKNGDIYPKWLTINAVKDEKGKVAKYIGIFSDITSLKQTEQHLEYLAHFDSLTNIPNRLLFRDRLKQAMIRANRSSNKVALLVFDLNRFKHINDTFGHLAGDQLLIEFSTRVIKSIRKEDTLARIGGDEFAIILEDINSKLDIEVVIKKTFDSISVPFNIKGHPVYITSSIGVAIYPTDAYTNETLLRNADMAMYVAKELGDNRVYFYEESLKDKYFQRLSVETNLREAIDKEEFVLFYQPQVDLKTGNIIGMEALIRRQEAEWLVPPGKFIPLAEETGLIVPICEWTLKAACRQNILWQREGLTHLRVAVNITATQLFSIELLKTVENILKTTGLDPKDLELELTERVLIRDAQTALNLMNDLKSLGICLSIDDFGTGYSSLNYLHRFPIDKLKIDISFVKDCTRDPSSASITKAIIALAHNLNLRVIAEGVETKDQLLFLKEHGCDEIQGFYYSVPLSPEKFKKFVISSKNIHDLLK
jgi:diguanylate cyclase (GGDEF)-like protein/PAS domain S-box-containing protein